MAEPKGLKKPVELQSELASMLGETELPRTEITKKLWEYIKKNGLQTKTENGKPENAGKFIVADATLLPIFKKTKSTSKSGKLTDLTGLKEGETINMMQMAAVVGANIKQILYGLFSEQAFLNDLNMLLERSNSTLRNKRATHKRSLEQCLAFYQ